MREVNGNVVSSFNTTGCSNLKISKVPRRGFVTVMSASSGTGGHASMFIEAYMGADTVFNLLPYDHREWAEGYFEDQGIDHSASTDALVACTMLVDLTARSSASAQLAAGSSGSSSSGTFDMSINAGVIQLYGGDNDPTHMYRMVEAYAATLDNGTGKHTTSYDLDRIKLESLWAAINRFALKVGRGRYTYRLTGGKLGWLMSRPGQRGVNCADFVVKVLKEAGISTISNGLVNTPHRIAAGG